MKSNETKRERFVRLAEARTNKILNMLQLLANCANRSTYDYTQEDVDKIFSAIQTQLNETKKAFINSSPTEKKRFSLD